MKVFFNEPMDNSLTFTGHYTIPNWGSPVTAIPFASGSQVLLAFNGSFPNGIYQVHMEDLWDQQGSLIADSFAIAEFQVVIDTVHQPYLTRASVLGSYQILLEFSAPMQTASLTNPVNYRLNPMGSITSATQESDHSVKSSHRVL